LRQPRAAPRLASISRDLLGRPDPVTSAIMRPTRSHAALSSLGLMTPVRRLRDLIFLFRFNHFGKCVQEIVMNVRVPALPQAHDVMNGPRHLPAMRATTCRSTRSGCRRKMSMTPKGRFGRSSFRAWRLDNAQVAWCVTLVRNAWGNTVSTVSMDRVVAIGTSLASNSH
jgi:hypothetical protein